MKYDVFISYRRSTGLEMARALSQQLDRLGVKNFFDLEEIQTGQFNEKIYDSINEATYVVFIMSNGALDRCVNADDWVRKELEYAYGKGKQVIPVTWIGQVPSYPEKLPKKISVIRNAQIKEIDRGAAFKDTVLKLVREGMPGVWTSDDMKRQEAEDVLLSRARRYKQNDYVIDRQERAALEKLAMELGIDPVTREKIIEKVENETVVPDNVRVTTLQPATGESEFRLFLSTIQRSFDYRGVSGRKEYWVYFVGFLLVEFVMLLFDAMFFDEPITMCLFALLFVVPFLALAGRRARDCGYSGWLASICLIPYVGLLGVLFLGLKKGKFV